MQARLRLLMFTLAGVALLALTTCGGSSAPSPSPSPPPPFQGVEALYGIASTSLLNYFKAFTINATTGDVTVLPTQPPPILGSDGMVGVDAKFLYISRPVATGLPPGEGEIFGYSLDPSTGAPTPLAESPFPLPAGASPRGLATVPNSHSLYVADTGVGGIDAFNVDGVTGTPTPIPGSPFPAGYVTQLAADPSGKFLYASDDDAPGEILGFTIDSTGALTPVPGSPFTIPGQTVANSVPYGIVDDGSFVYVALSASNQIAAFSIDSVTGALTSVPGSPFPTGNAPFALALAGNFLYAVNEQVGSISGYSINANTGALMPVPGSPFTSNVSFTAADFTGKYLFVSTSTGEFRYDIDTTTGALSYGGVAQGGIDGPLYLTIVHFPSSAAQ